MAKVFITGSTDGIGLIAASMLMRQGHQVIFHARNEKRKADLQSKIGEEHRILVADLRDHEATVQLAQEVNAFGTMHAVIHNAGLYDAPMHDILAVNTLAPYVLSCLIKKPKRLIYISSGMHLGGEVKVGHLRNATGSISYSDTKLQVLLLSNYIARTKMDVLSNAVNPGWVPTKMGGKGAPDDLQRGAETQVWLAESEDSAAKVSGHYWFHKRIQQQHKEAGNLKLQDELIETCKQRTGIDFTW